MNDKLLDHIYHRTRVDAHITGNILLVAVMAILALTLGAKFQPFRYGAKWLEPVRLVWIEDQQGWALESSLVAGNNFPPAQNRGPVDIREIYPISVSVMLAVGVVAIAYFIYRCARRQTRLMNSVFANEPMRPYERPWEEIRVTFWALNATLAFILFFFLS